MLVMIVLFCFLAFGQAYAGEAFDPAYREIVPAENVREFLSQPACDPLPVGVVGKLSGTWTPNKENIELLEDALPFALKKSIRESDLIGPKAREILTQDKSIAAHVRQYAGIIMDGRKMILMIAAPRYEIDFDGRHDMQEYADTHWREHPIGTCDGGPDDFVVLYNPGDKRFGKFEFNCTFAGCKVP